MEASQHSEQSSCGKESDWSLAGEKLLEKKSDGDWGTKSKVAKHQQRQ